MKQGDLFGSASSAPRGADPRPSPPPPEEVTAKPAPVVVAPAVVAPAVVAPNAEPVPAWRKKPVEPKVLSVSELTWQLKDTITRRFERVIVRGEVTGFRGPNVRGHLYFAIKDETSQLDVKVWQSQARALKFQVRDGLSLIIEGSLDVYEAQGRYSLIAQKLEPEGVGARALAFEQLKAKLLKDGLIGEGRTKPKRPLPFLPRRIGVVTSSSGAAWRDFLKVLQRRHPRASVLFCNARVQGEEAAIEIARGVRWLAKTDVDVIVVTRGGGSVEDLWSFNEERVVRAIFDSPVPVISAVGHEIDVTLSDLVADVRASTPTAAAELVVPVTSELLHRLDTTKHRLEQAIERKTLEANHRISALRNRLGDPRQRLSSKRLRLAELAERLRRVETLEVRRRQKQLEALESRLTRARPQSQLSDRRKAFAALVARLRPVLGRRSRDERARLLALRVSLERATPLPKIRDLKRRLETANGRLPLVLRRRVERDRERLYALSAKLNALSPLAVLGRGYAIALSGETVVRRAGDVAVGDVLTVRLDRGDSVTARVETRSTGSNEE